jgi:hypothetical protein
MHTQIPIRQRRQNKGYFVLIILVFGAIFLLMFTSLSGLVVTQKRLSSRAVNNEQALQIAEAGLDYYRWYLAHNPGDTTNGTTTPQPYVHSYEDPEGGAAGAFELTISGSGSCGETSAVDITSVGHTDAEPTIERTVYGRYARPTVAGFASIINANVWAGADRIIIGPYHSNGGIRMDGTHNSTVSSGVTSWLCTSSFGCTPNQTKDGVWSNAPVNSSLWQFPATPISFVGLSLDLADMQDKATNSGGIYIGPSGDYGYRIAFRNNGTFDVYVVDTTTSYWGNPIGGAADWQTERNVISDDDYLATYTIPASCPVIFVEDKVWLEGQVSGKVTLAAADVDTTGVNPSIILHNNITYTSASSGLLAIAEQDVLVGLVVPGTPPNGIGMSLTGIFIAQNGRFGRNHYCTNCSAGGVNRGLPSSLDPYVKRTSLTSNGTVVSNGRVGTKWTSGGVFSSGFETRYDAYDRNLVSSPPPLTPYVSDDYTFIEWREMED